MILEVPPLPYPYEALEPHLSARTLRAHHEGHMANYVRTVNELVSRIPAVEAELLRLAPDQRLPRIVEYSRKTAWTQLNDAASQVVNHLFYFRSMKPRGGGPPTDPELARAIADAFGNWDSFVAQWRATAKGLFGSGWVWLLRDGRKLRIVSTPNGTIPSFGRPLVVMDVWEHAYYLDYTFRRGEYSDVFLEQLVAWPSLTI